MKVCDGGAPLVNNHFISRSSTPKSGIEARLFQWFEAIRSLGLGGDFFLPLITAYPSVHSALRLATSFTKVKRSPPTQTSLCEGAGNTTTVVHSH